MIIQFKTINDLNEVIKDTKKNCDFIQLANIAIQRLIEKEMSAQTKFYIVA
jgi:hypothetical protein